MERNDRNRGRRRRKVCAFCADKVETIDYKDVARLRRYLSERAKIVPRRVTGTCARGVFYFAPALYLFNSIKFMALICALC